MTKQPRVETYNYSGADTKPHVLVESNNLMIIRTVDNMDPDILLKKAQINQEATICEKLDHYPEASVWVYKITTSNPVLDREEIKIALRNYSNSEELDFVGTVMQRKDTKVYQIYTGNLFLRFEDKVGENEKSAFLREYGLTQKSVSLQFDPQAYFLEPENKAYNKVFELANSLLKNSLVKLCHPELVVKRKSFKPMESAQLEQINEDWARKLIGLDGAWKISKGEGVTICVIDDGIDYNHKAFTTDNKIIASRDMLKSDNVHALHLYNSEMHGTACASVACSSDENVPGVAPQANLMVVRCKGLGSVLEAEAIAWAADQGADIISCSWGPSDGDLRDPGDDSLMVHPIPDHTRLAIDYAVKTGRDGKGCLIFFAAGNGKEPVNTDGYASYPKVMAIGAVQKDYEPTLYSDYGSPLFCCFPSSKIVVYTDRVQTVYGLKSADRSGILGYADGDYYDRFGGTSAAAPGVAGVAALMLSIAPSLKWEEAKKMLSDSCILPVQTSIEYDVNYGYGIIDAELLVRNAQNINLQKKINMNNTKTYALHIGLDRVDEEVYSGTFSDLNGCVLDAEAYRTITKNYLTQKAFILYNEDATREGFKAEMLKLIALADAGDTVIITYAGHGSLVADTNGDEKDKTDETLILFDGPWIDDETNDLWAQFKEDVNVIWISDSCHSGSNSRGNFTSRTIIRENKRGDGERVRGIPPSAAQQAFRKRSKDIISNLDKIETKGRALNNIDIKANILTMAACMDNELAWEAESGGLFTSRFIEVWNQYNDITYEELYQKISTLMPGKQNPVCKQYGGGAALYKKKTWKQSQIDEVENNSKEAQKGSALNRSGVFFTDDLLITSESNRLQLNEDDTRGSTKVKDVNISSGLIKNPTRSGESKWDAAYQTMLKVSDTEAIEFIEPDVISYINADPFKGSNESRGTSKFLSTYPNPEDLNLENPFIWHLGDDFTQLYKASREACPELRINRPKDRNAYPLVAHIDTGALPSHPTLPEHWERNLSRDFGNYYDKDSWLKKNGLLEQQGHGQATMALLAGNKITPLQSDKNFTGYMGAFPYARVMSLRISDSVIILQANKFAQAVEYAISVKADVISMSMAGAPSHTMLRAINKAYEAGLIVVSAAGNCWSKGIKSITPDQMLYPARLNRVISAVGVTATNKPYLVHLNKENSRAAGGKYMQSCYGPTECMGTAVAAYTPNISWADGQLGELFRRTGGGTSSATPQIAAAAALYIHHYRSWFEDEENIPVDQLWLKAEIVRQALFKSAKLPTADLQAYFGNGILKAFDALKYKPQAIKDGLLLMDSCGKVAPDSIGRSWYNDLIKLWFTGARSRGRLSAKEQRLQSMVAMEIEQLIICHDELKEYADLNIYSEGIMRAIMQLNSSSDFLKKIIKNKLEIISGNSVSASGFRGSRQGVSVINIENLAIRIQSNNTAYKIKQSEVTSQDKSQGQRSQFEIFLDPQQSRSSDARLNLTISRNADQAILISKNYESEHVEHEWVIPNIEKAKTRGARSNYISYNDDLIIELINNGASADSRGLREFYGKLKKIGVRVFRSLLDEPVSGLEGLITYDPKGGAWSPFLQKYNYKNGTSNKGLLLLHGTFSETQASFEDLFINSDFKEYIHEQYGSAIFGFEMSTIRSGIAKNAKQLKIALDMASLNDIELDVIGFSRGCLVARKVFQNDTRMILIGGTNVGTPLATSDNILKLINRATNLLGLLHPSIATIAKVASMLAKGVMNMRGISDQAENSSIIDKISESFLPNQKQLFIGSNFKGSRLNVFDPTLDYLIFSGKGNDGITPIDSAILAQNRKYYVPMSEKTHHFDYFNQGDVIEEMIKHLNDGQVYA